MANNNNKNIVWDIYSPLYLDTSTGFPTEIPSGSVLDIGGVVGPYFTVGGKELLFADGSTTGGALVASLNLQSTYENSSLAGEPAVISLESGRDFVIDAPDVPGVSFKIDSTTGAVVIAGDLIVGGTQTIVNSIINESSHIRLTAGSPSEAALHIQPSPNDNLFADLLYISAERTADDSYGSPAIVIDSSGSTLITTLTVANDLVVSTGIINGVNLSNFYNDYRNHIRINTGYKHIAAEINIAPSSFVEINENRNVQTILEFLGLSINNIDAQIIGLHEDVDGIQEQIDALKTVDSNNPTGHTFIAAEPLNEWVIEHNKNSKNFMFNVFDEEGFMFHPDSARIVDDNTFVLRFGAPQAGRVNMMFYVV